MGNDLWYPSIIWTTHIALLLLTIVMPLTPSHSSEVYKMQTRGVVTAISNTPLVLPTPPLQQCSISVSEELEDVMNRTVVLPMGWCQ